MDSYRKKKLKKSKIIFFHEKDYVNKKRTKINLKNFFHRTSFSKKSKELH